MEDAKGVEEENASDTILSDVRYLGIPKFTFDTMSNMTHKLTSLTAFLLVYFVL